MLFSILFLASPSPTFAQSPPDHVSRSARESAKPECTADKEFEAAVKSAYGNQTARAGASLVVMDRASGRVLCEAAHRDDVSFYPASSIKTLIALAVLKKVDAGEVRLGDQIAINQRNAKAETAFWGPTYGPGKRVTVSKLLTDMIVVSNNTATNQLIDVAGKDFINRTAKELGLDGLAVHRKVYSGSVPAEDPMPPQKNTATSRGLAKLYVKIASPQEKLLSHSSRDFLIKILGDQSFHDRLDKNFPSNVKLFHKPGNTSRVAADAGFFYFGENQAKIAVIAALQDFPSYGPLQKLGKNTLDLTTELSQRDTTP